MQLSDATTKYLDFNYHLTEKTRHIYTTHLARLLAAVGDIPLTDITPLMLARFMGSLRRANGTAYAPAYKHQIYRTLNTFLKHAVTVGWLASNPLATVKPPPLPKGPKPRLSLARIEALITAIRTTRGGRCNERNLAIILLMIDSGLRRAEAVTLDIDQLDIDAATVRIYDPKTMQWRFIPIGPYTVDAIKAYTPTRRPSQPTNRLFLNATGGPMKPDAINSVIKRLQARLDFPLWPHLLRHTFANLYLKRGDLRRLQLILGHSDIRTTAEFYTLPDFEDIQTEHADCSPLAQLNSK